MNPFTEADNATIINIDSSDRNPSFIENHANDEKHQLNLPLLLQQSYATYQLRKLSITLKWCALDHSSNVRKLISYVVFTFLTIVVPLFTSLFLHVPASASQLDPFNFNKLLQIPESSLAIIAFFTLSRFFPRYGLRQLLFLDALQDDSMYVRRGYTRELQKAFRYLACMMLPSFCVELVHKIIFFLNVEISVPSCGTPLKWFVFVSVLVSWVYRTGLFLLACVLFRLTCELQILRFEGLHKLFEGCESDASIIFGEHVRIRRQLWITSHRYRFFIISCLLTITVSQLGSLLLVLEAKSDTTFFNSADLVICSAVQLCGFFLCLMGAARITHRAQGIVSIGTKWHMVVTNASAESEQWKAQMPEGPPSPTAIDSDSSDINVAVTPQRPSSFQTRHALVTYLQHNYGGITLFGFVLDRGLLHTLFAFEFSMVLWILSMVAV
ncbi:uncharacterized protein LOC109796289 isoform X2 [Cajanus cajan]|uniref:uncharacterized protein LOC109796288 isoform X2 n=1 Tax=Cajanus cajan TaxID=3821 RepID=UPI00098D8185|nr:uncharacterized protein LOC109796288 isoform X2 [Cajanus cajan]XP_020211565.1 uncharacterized protein LOC109796289 isoform X2 [Cajanus cajan]